MLTCNFIKKGLYCKYVAGTDWTLSRSNFHQQIHKSYPGLLPTSKTDKFAIIVDG